MKDNKGFNLISVIIMICVTSITSAITAGVIVTNNYGLSYGNLGEDEPLNDFLKAYSNIIDNYYEDVNKEAMLDSALNAMLNYLGDNYTTYLNEAQSEELAKRLAGTYKGIGITIQGNEIIKIAKNSPAEQKGLLIGDIITNVNNQDMTNEAIEFVAEKISKAITTSENGNVHLTVKRGEEFLNFELEIVTLNTADVDYELKENGIGYLQMSVFSRTLKSQVEDALNDMENNGMQKLIIDMRDNTGGYLESAEEVASLFLEKGKLIYSLQDKNNKNDFYDKTEEKRTYPIVVILNGGSASAAEILAAALKDSYGVVLVGETSFGKGKVQQTYEMGDGSMAKYTSAKWLRPNGNCIDKIGIVPDYEVKKTTEKDEYGNEIKTIDSQLEKAIEVISAM